MARIRTIKPSFWPDTGTLSRDARLLAVVLISMADDEGRFIATPTAIRGYGYPYDDDVTDAKVKRWLDEIAKHCQSETSSVPRLHLYAIDGLRYAVWLKYKQNQRISHPQPSPIPPPQGEAFHA